MAVTIINRPIGHKLSTTQLDGELSDSAGDAVIYVPGGHSLSTGDYIYIESNFESYNGFKYVDAVSYDYFKIKNSEGGSYVAFKQNADITFYISVLDHGFQSVHLPIVYELESDINPNNVSEESYTPIVVDSQQDNNGYTQLNLSTGLDSPMALNWINLVGEGDLSGPYQIIEVVADWAIVINLAYDASNDLTIYQVVNWYNNYFITVNVYGGLGIDHRWESERPYELISTIKLTPDSNNRIKFSVADILKGHIHTRNNLILDTLPCNIDFFTQFYISYFESFDFSNGSEISIFQGDINDDMVNFEGIAINAKMPFKSVNQGHISDYIGSETIEGRWLTLQDRPIAFIDRFFDLSFINIYSGIDVNVVIFKSLNGIVTETETIELENPGLGVIRLPLEIGSGFDLYCLQASTVGISGTPSDTIAIDLGSVLTWVSRNIDPDLVNWTTTIVTEVALGDSSAWDETSEMLYKNYAFIPGYEYEITVTLTRTISGSGSVLMIMDTLSITDDSFVTQVSENHIPSGTNGEVYNITINFVATANCTKVVIQRHEIGQANSFSQTVFSAVSGTQTSPEIPDIPSVNLTEQLCVDIVEDCNTFLNDNLRLLEAGPFRELE